MAAVMTRRQWRVISALVTVALIAGGGWWWRGELRRAEIARALPPVPDLSAAPEELRRRTGTAVARADVHTLSRLYHANGFFDEAIRCYEWLEKSEPLEPRWPHRHATLLAGEGKIEPALPLWARVVEQAPDYVPARLRLAEALLKSNQSDRAAKMYREVLQRAPDDPHALLGLARIEVEAGRWEDARGHLEKVVARTNYELGYDLIVTVYEHLGLAPRAAEVRARAKASGAYRDPPDPWHDELMDDCHDAYRLSLVAGAAGRSGETERALRLLQRAVALAPADVTVRFQLATLLVQRREPKRAREEFERCTVLAPTFSDAWAHLSALLQQSGDSSGAERTLAAGLRACPDSPGLHLMRARSLRESGRWEEAAAEYRASIRLRPHEADAYLELATTLFRLERVPEGRRELDRALAAEPDHPTALSLLAYHAITARNETDARKWLARVRAQPRVPREQSDRLLAAYREQFGRDFR